MMAYPYLYTPNGIRGRVDARKHKIPYPYPHIFRYGGVGVGFSFVGVKTWGRVRAFYHVVIFIFDGGLTCNMLRDLICPQFEFLKLLSENKMKTLADNEKMTNTERDLKTSILSEFTQTRRNIQSSYQDKQSRINIANAHMRASLTSSEKFASRHQSSADDIYLDQFDYDDLLSAYHFAVNKTMFENGLPPHIMENGIYPGYE